MHLSHKGFVFPHIQIGVFRENPDSVEGFSPNYLRYIRRRESYQRKRTMLFA